MNIFKIYTVGKMSGLTYEEQMGWRRNIENRVRYKADVPVQFIHPPLFYGYHQKLHKTESEIKEWELNQVLSSDIIIVNLDGINESVGSHFEMGAVNAMNMFGNRHIFVVGIGDSAVHPWIDLSFIRRESNIEDAADYIASYLLV